jgi:restriction system protein
MAIPDFQSIMLPLLKHAGDNKEHSLGDARESLAASFALTPEEKAVLLPSGRQPLFANRVAWAKTYLARAELLRAVRRGSFQIAGRGLDLLSGNSGQCLISSAPQPVRSPEIGLRDDSAPCSIRRWS